MILRRCLKRVRFFSTQPADDLGRYLHALEDDEEDGKEEERRAKQMKNESRRLSRRSSYKPDDDGPQLRKPTSREISEVNQLLSKDLDRLEQQQQQSCDDQIIICSEACESLLRQCAATKATAEGKRLHTFLSRTGQLKNTYLANLTIQMFASCGCVDEAVSVFDSLNPPNVFSWNIMIAAYSQNGRLQEARRLFERMPRKSVVSWNTMIAAYVQRGLHHQALDLFDQMNEEPSKITFIHVLQACENVGAIERAERIHTCIISRGWESDVILSTALFKVFAKHGDMQRARNIFDRMPRRDVLCWNSMVAAYVRRGNLEEALNLFMSMPDRSSASWNLMITAYVQSGRSKRALGLFKAMDLEGVQPSRITFLAALSACTSLADGKQIHLELEDAGFAVDDTSGTALIDMYGRCGGPEAASHVFFQMSQQNCIAWAALVAAYAQNGHGEEAVEIFNLMCLDGLTPNQINFVNLLHACSHGGLLKYGLCFFQSLISDHALEPIFEHYTCMVDLLARTGRTESAEKLIKAMPFEPDVVPWMTLLAACKTHHDVERGAIAAEEILKLSPGHGAAYSLLANMYSDEVRMGRRCPMSSCIGELTGSDKQIELGSLNSLDQQRKRT